MRPRTFNYDDYVEGDTVWPLRVNIFEVIDDNKLPADGESLSARFHLRDASGALVVEQSSALGTLAKDGNSFIVSAFSAPAKGGYKFQFELTINGYVMTVLEGALTVLEDLTHG